MKTLTLLILAIPFLAQADDVVPIDSVNSYVNIRMLPSSASEIVGRLEQGKSAKLVESIPDWHEIDIDGDATGFISADWTRVVAETAEARNEEVKNSDSEITVAEADAEIPTVESDGAVNVEKPAEASVTETETSAEPPVEAGEAPASEEVIEPAELPAVETPAVAATAPAAVAAMQSMKGATGFLAKFTSPTEAGRSLIFDDGNNIGIGTTEPKQRLEVNGNIQIHEQNSSVAGLMITQAGGETGYIMHNRASTLTIGAGSIDRITISRDGNVGFGVTRPANPIEMASGAHVTTGGVWTNSSSREKKENIAALSTADALDTLAALEPVRFNYKNDRLEDYVGFIAEDVPDLVATADREGLSAMDIVAVLTKVVQEQEKRIAELEARIDHR